MELINTTQVPAELVVSELSADDDGASVRLGSLVARATFDVKSNGALALSAEPQPVLRMEETTELGFLPRDVVPPRPPGLDLVVLAAAYAPGGRPVSEMTVTLSVGDYRREIAVTGDRLWVQTEDGWMLGPPAEFLRMPLTWERTFGGTAEVWLDASSPIDVRDPYNPSGRGFDAIPHMDGLQHSFGCADGFPRLAYERIAPNVEHPSLRVTASEDQPEPYCWAPLAIDMGLRAKWVVAAMAPSAPGRDELPDGVQRLRDAAPKEGMRFAHPDLRIPAPEPGTPVGLSGCTPSGNWRFTWPAFRLVGDYVLGDRTGERPLDPQSAVLLPDQGLLVVTYRAWFRFAVDNQDIERAIRIRIVG